LKSDQPDAETSTSQYTTLTRDVHDFGGVRNPPIPGSERQQTHTLDGAAKGISHIDLYFCHFWIFQNYASLPLYSGCIIILMMGTLNQSASQQISTIPVTLTPGVWPSLSEFTDIRPKAIVTQAARRITSHRSTTVQWKRLSGSFL